MTETKKQIAEYGGVASPALTDRVLIQRGATGSPFGHVLVGDFLDRQHTTSDVTGNSSVGGALAVTGAATFGSTLGLTGNFSVNTNKFVVTASSGDTAVAGTFAATGAATFGSTLGLTGNFAVNTDKFVVTASSGNTAVAGTFAATGAATFGSTLGLTGNFTVNSNKFVVTASSGDTAVAGTFAATGAATFGDTIGVTGTATFAGSAVIGNAGSAKWAVSAGDIAMASGQNATLTLGGVGQTWTLRTSSGGATIARFTGGNSSTSPRFETNLNANSRTVLGRTHVSPGAITLSGAYSSSNAPFAAIWSQIGAPGTTGQYDFSRISVSSDTVDLGAASAGAALAVRSQFGGTGSDGNTTSGSRRSLYVELIKSGATRSAALGDSPFYVGAVITSDMRDTDGGSAPILGGTLASSSQRGIGQNFGFGFYGRLTSTAANYRTNAGGEIDIAIEAGASAGNNLGLQIIALAEHVNQGVQEDTALRFGGQVGAAKLRDLVSVGGVSGTDALDTTNGTMWRWVPGSNYPFPATNNGFNVKDGVFSGYAFLSKGFHVAGGSGVSAGTTRIGTTYFTPTSGGLTIGASGRTGLAVGSTISGGALVSASLGTTAYENMVLDDDYQGAYVVTGVSAGNITELTVLTQSVVNGSAPSNPISLRLRRADGGVFPGAATGTPGTTSIPISGVASHVTITDYFAGRLLRFTSGTQSGQERTISAYNATTKTLTVSAFGGAPSSGDTFEIVPQYVTINQTWTARNDIVFGDAADDIGFYGATPIAQQTGIAVSAAAIHAALVNLGLITA